METQPESLSLRLVAKDIWALYAVDNNGETRFIGVFSPDEHLQKGFNGVHNPYEKSVDKP